MSGTKWVYYFGEGSKSDKQLLGGKGANLSEMVNLGLPIPLGYTLTSTSCIAFQESKQWPAGLAEQVQAATQRLERDTQQRLADGKNPLLLSVRSGAAVSMPGMMDTVLNLGLNDDVVDGWIRSTGNERFCLDSYRRFIQMYSDVVKGIHKTEFRALLDLLKEKYGVVNDHELTPAHLRELVGQFKALYVKETGEAFPTDPYDQLTSSINAVFLSWNNERAIKYRNLNKIPHNMGTAVNVQAMVYGNLNNNSGTGVAFTRDPSTGENVRYGEYLMNAQGEDVVAGVRTPNTLTVMQRDLPHLHKQLLDIFDLLENHYKDMQDIEFTIQEGKLYILQTRNGKRTAPAALKMAVDMYKSGFITAEQAVMRVTPAQLDQLLHKKLDDNAEAKATVLCKGLPASPGAAVGKVCFSAEQAVEDSAGGEPVILVRLETSPDDIEGMHVAQGVLTARGGMTSHAAVVARGMNLCCVAGCSTISVDEEKGVVTFADGTVLRRGDWLSLNGSRGVALAGQLPVVTPEISGDFNEFLSVCDSVARMEVYANADTPKDAQASLDFGAMGIGLVRTEHMFFDKRRLAAVQEMIVADDIASRKRALAKLLPFQIEDFTGILQVMTGKPVIIRLLDPPLHEFLPHADDEENVNMLSRQLNVTVAALRKKISSLQEVNPMLGFRGCRLGLVYPEINEMQVEAIFKAALAVKAQGGDPRPQIEIPLAGSVEEFMPLKRMIRRVAQETGIEGKVHYEIGTMIETPRACLIAHQLAAEAEFMSFGTNDLTPMTCGFSRDDSASFLKHYVAKGIYKADPFQSLDGTGVAQMMVLTDELVRSVRPNMDIGICGEHGGDPDSIDICHRVGLDNISCSPYRVPVARLAAAQSAVRFPGNPHDWPANIRARL
jgi:pyruvate,orthophosphate dikinase